ncbi:hypothetical protein [Afipia sp. GAS231]|uniref:hypothetical protein n=1 Tax=Afipia sp. GAS231 TaxID=1882747 RepID=UPI00087DDD87|nr:hypothetical protein [Afipia sp. GAS231]SDO48881.1 hypothetical protein SAMN05444050_4259 [Afipia sp. GAS231]
MPELLPVGLAFAYDARFVPKGGRIPRERYFLGKDTGLIRQAKPHEVALAYRIHIPHSSDHQEYTFEILQFDDQLWWPIRLPDVDVATDPNSAARCIEELAISGIDPARMYQNAGSKRHLSIRDLQPIETVPIRSVEWIRYDEGLARAQIRAFGNLMLFRHRAYVLGGHPIYVKRRNLTRWKEKDKVWVISTSPDRLWDPAAGDLWKGAGDPPSIHYSLRGAKFQFFKQAEAAAASAYSTVHSMPRIEVVMDLPNQPSLMEIALDALFREACDLLRELPIDKPSFGLWKGSYGSEAPDLPEMLPVASTFEYAVRRAVDETTSLHRYSALLRLAQSISTCSHVARQYRYLESVIKAILAGPEFQDLADAQTPLTPEEEESLRSFG